MYVGGGGGGLKQKVVILHSVIRKEMRLAYPATKSRSSLHKDVAKHKTHVLQRNNRVQFLFLCRRL